MTLGQKLRMLRHLEGHLRGLGRELTQAEVVRAIKTELHKSISQSYLSLIEHGARPHLSHSSRQLLAQFFKVHPGYLVSDPPGFQTELSADVAPVETALDRWLREGAARLGPRSGRSAAALDRLAAHADSRGCLVLLGEMLAMPGLVDRLSETLDSRRSGHELACDLSRLLCHRLRAERPVVRARRDTANLHLHAHLPFVHHLHIDHHHVGHAHGHGASTAVSPINFATVMAFLAWFGGTGYLLTSQFRWLAMPGAGPRHAGRRRRRRRRVLGDGARALVAGREHAERGLSDGRRPRAASAIRFARGHRRADLFARRHAALVRRAKRRRPRDRERRGSGRDGVRPRHRLRAALGRARGRPIMRRMEWGSNR